jgi:maltose alpha-D-glucosyltransferase/alpha-amylase
LHLGQVLFSSQGIWIIDWEGEPHRTLQERRQKGSPLRDVAGLLRSLAYAASYLYCNAENSRANAFQEALSRLAQEMEKALLSRYEAKTQGLLTLPQDSGFRLLLLEAFAWQKALYELRYELSHRPGWVRTALQSLVWFLERKQRFGTPWAEWEG